jgi:hypothetical protein
MGDDPHFRSPGLSWARLRSSHLNGALCAANNCRGTGLAHRPPKERWLAGRVTELPDRVCRRKRSGAGGRQREQRQH